jgi:diamine N-acetyltransferase
MEPYWRRMGVGWDNAMADGSSPPQAATPNDVTLTLSIRRACARDTRTLTALARETFLSTFGHLYPPEDLSAFLAAAYGDDQQGHEIADPARLNLIAELGGAPVGFAQAGPLKLPIDPRQDRAPLELYRLYTIQPVHGLGIAQMLITETLDWMAAVGAGDAFLGVWSQNARAQAFYRRHGFTVVGGYQFPVGRVLDDEFIMRRPLAPEPVDS